MAVLNMKFADPAITRVFSDVRGSVNFGRLVDEDLHGYHSGLIALMEQLGAQGPNFQIEFTWNLIGGEGVFHVVQYKRLREIDLSEIEAPDLPEEALISTDQFQGHGVIQGILHAVVINPFAFQEETREETLRKLARINRELGDRGERYIFVCPGGWAPPTRAGASRSTSAASPRPRPSWSTASTSAAVPPSPWSATR